MIGTNFALLQFMWILVSGSLLPSRGAVFPALQAIGLADTEARRAWAAMRGGGWQIAGLLRLWQAQIEGLEGFYYHRYGGYRGVNADITAIFRPQLKGWQGKHYYPPAGKVLPRAFLRVDSLDPSDQRLQRDLVEQVVCWLEPDEAAVFDAGFKLSDLLAAGLVRFVLRLAKIFTARRNVPAPRKPLGRTAIYGEWVHPMVRAYGDHHVPAMPPDRVVTCEEAGRSLRSEVWTDLILPGVEPDPRNLTFRVAAIYDPDFSEQWLLASDLPLEPADLRALYGDRWPVEQIPNAAKNMVGAHRRFVFCDESIHRLPELALLASSIQSFLAAACRWPRPVFGIAAPAGPPGGCGASFSGDFFQIRSACRSEFGKKVRSRAISRRALRRIGADRDPGSRKSTLPGPQLNC